MRMLKLSRMVDTLNIRLGQAQKEVLGFTQFLEDELRSIKDLDKEVVTV